MEVGGTDTVPAGWSPRISAGEETLLVPRGLLWRAVCDGSSLLSADPQRARIDQDMKKLTSFSWSDKDTKIGILGNAIEGAILITLRYLTNSYNTL